MFRLLLGLSVAFVCTPALRAADEPDRAAIRKKMEKAMGPLPGADRKVPPDAKIEAEEKLRQEGIALWLAALNPQVLAVVRKSSLQETLGRERMFFTVQGAVEAYERTRSTRREGAGPAALGGVLSR